MIRTLLLARLLMQPAHAAKKREFYGPAYEEARTEWEKALRLDPANPDAPYGLERIRRLYAGVADPDDVREALRQ